MSAILTLAYGAVSYLVFFGTFLYAIGFLGNLVVPKSLDSGATESWSSALAVNLALLSIFAVQHSVMARPAFKRLLTRVIPKSIERSTYVLASSAALIGVNSAGLKIIALPQANAGADFQHAICIG